jgi:Holliday junction resolvasome RuvABC endonuclease subunit
MIKVCKKNYFMGIDPSINGTGVVILDKELNIVESLHYKFNNKKNLYVINSKKELKLINNDKDLKGETIGREIAKLVKKYDPIINIEGYAYNGGGLVFQIAEFVGAIKTHIKLLKKKVETIGITNLKKRVTGNGNATKLHIKIALEKYVGHSFGDNDDLNDAYSLALIAAKKF